MKNERLKDSLDDALSGIGENPWLLRQVMARAESEENKPVKKRISLGTVVIAVLVLALMSAGIAAVSQWNVLDFLRKWDKDEPLVTVEIRQKDETENARAQVESAVYDGGTLAFDLTLENKHPEVPEWFMFETFTVNGMEVEPGQIWEDNPGENIYNIVPFDNQWLPNWEYYDGTAMCGELVRLPAEIAGAENVHVEMIVKVYRPTRPVALIDRWNKDDSSFREELENLIAEGYYVIPAEKSWSDNETLIPSEGQFVPEEDLEACPSGWAEALGGPLEQDIMGPLTEETMEIRFDVKKSALTDNITPLQAQEVYENEYCTAVYDQADISPLSLYLTLRITPKDDRCKPVGGCRLTDGEGKDFRDPRFIPLMKEESRTESGDLVWRYRWDQLLIRNLPDTISLTCRLENGEDLVFPIKVR